MAAPTPSPPEPETQPVAPSVVVDIRGTPCEEFMSEMRYYSDLALRTGTGIGFTISRGQSLYLALGPYGIDPVLGAYTITPDDFGTDYELRCDADAATVAAYQPDYEGVYKAAAWLRDNLGRIVRPPPTTRP